jgi:hypothetical protein
MAHEMTDRVAGKSKRPIITSYDSGYEHSLEHLVFVRQMVEETVVEIEIDEPDESYEITAIAS